MERGAIARMICELGKEEVQVSLEHHRFFKRLKSAFL